MTLVEMLVATTMTLIIMGIVAQLFGVVANTLNGSRDTIKMSADVRSVANMLRRDLAGITVKPVPPINSDAEGGYLEIVEGSTLTDASSGFSQLTGDCDDVLIFTTRSLDQPFVGRFLNSVSGNIEAIESPCAEVAWFCQPSPAALQVAPGSTLYTLYRRQLLVLEYPYAGGFTNSGTNAITASLPAAYNDYDLSLRPDGPLVRPNSLGDLTRREFRAWHDTVGPPSKSRFPYNNTVANIAPLTAGRAGEDVVLTNVIAFDVRVFDPRAPIRASAAGVGTTPGDPGYGSGANSGALGAYVDLGWAGGTAASLGSTFPPSGLTAFGSKGMNVCNAPNRKSLGAIYDTWSTHYEFNGIDEDNDGAVDQGTNSIDDIDVSGIANGVVDDAIEAETSPPYPTPLRGIEIRIRTYEPTSRQVRQTTVRHTFVPH